jgi:hypothetical protein
MSFDTCYPLQLAGIRTAVTGRQAPTPTPWRLPNQQAAQSVPLDSLDVQDLAAIDLIFRPSDLYLLGFTNASRQTFAFENQKDNVRGATSLGFPDAYKDMGIDRDSWLTVTLDEVEKALWEIAYCAGPPGRETMGKLVVGFCEASRFRDVERFVTAGSRFDCKLLKWDSAARAPADKLLQPA